MKTKTKRLSMREAIITQCWSCCGHYEDGKNPYMSYRKHEADLSWLQDNPRRVGYNNE